MPTLREGLTRLPHRDVRGIATRLGVRRVREHGKAAWIEGIAQAWAATGGAAQIVARLSPEARAAAMRLAQGGELPARLFFAEYGTVRRSGPGQSWRPPPWAAPASVSEELYYCGLLMARPPALIEKAERLAMPFDLQALLVDEAPGSGRCTATMAVGCDDRAGGVALALLHDVAQVLCFLLERPGLTLLHGRWLTPTALGELNGRLLQPERLPRPRAHARAPRLRFLFGLAAAAGLSAGAKVTPTGWVWLAEPACARLVRLWDAWCGLDLPLRRVYRLATAALPAPWPDLALKHVAGLPESFAAAQLARTVLGREPAFAAYFSAHLPDISALDAAAAELMDALADEWGVLARIAGPAKAASFQLTDVGRWLIAPAAGAPPTALDLADAGLVADLAVAEDGGWQLSVSSSARPLHLARVGAYARHVAFATATGSDCEAEPRHIYRLNAATVAAAAAAGHGLPALLEALAGLGIVPDRAQVTCLQAWHARGQELELVVLPLLRAARPELLAQLLAQPDVRAGLGEVLAPTAAVIAQTVPDFAARLRAAGFFPRGPVSEATQDGGSAALWLAGQVYAALGEHLALPLPPPFGDLAARLAALPPADQAAVQALWDRLRGDLLALLDGRSFRLPPKSSDPARWRPLIESAIARQQTLVLDYFTAGRNVLTRRTVTPYWIEEHRGIPYLRADCQLAGRVRLFRLDRIQDMTVQT